MRKSRAERKNSLWRISMAAVVLLAGLSQEIPAEAARGAKTMKIFPGEGTVQLPKPAVRGTVSVEEALQKRSSVRDFSAQPLTVAQVSQLLWAAQGTTRSWGARTAPSAGALYPLELYVVLPEGLFRYRSRVHELERISAGDLRSPLGGAALGQGPVREAAAVFVIAGVQERTSGKYGVRSERYVKIEAGHAAQNLMLQAVSLGLGSVPIGAFHDEKVRQVLGLPAGQEPLYLVPVGRPR